MRMYTNENLKVVKLQKEELENIQSSNFDLILIAETIHGLKVSDSDGLIVIDVVVW